jgi:hypothetical protein
VVLIGLVALLAVGIFVSDVLERLLVEGPQLTVIAPRASGLEPGSEVWVAGSQMGRILEVGFLDPEAGDERLLIRSVLRRDIGRVLREDATAIVRRSSLLAPNVLSVRPGSPEAPPFDYGDTLHVSIPVNTVKLLAGADSVRTRFATLRPLAATLRERLTEGPGTWAELSRDSALQTDLRARMRQLRQLALESRSEGTLGRLAVDTVIMASLTASAERVRLALDREGGRTWLAGTSELGGTLDSIAGRLERMQARMRNAEGSAGRFRHDAELADQVRLFRARVDSVKAELMADPFRWLRFQLF